MPAADYVLAIDIGSSKTSCSLFTTELLHVVTREAPTPVISEPEISSIARSIPLDVLWQLAARLTKDVLRASNILPSQVSRMAVTGQRESMVFLDDRGQALYAGPNTDLRALMEGAAIDETHLDYVYKTTGHRPAFMFAPAKLKWMQLQRQKEFAPIDKVISLPDWLVFKLTGQVISETTLAQESGYADLNGNPAAELFSKVGLSSKFFPRLASSGSLVGRPGDTKSLGLQNANVYLAGPDTQCALLGMGATNEGDVGIAAGFSSPLQMVTSRPVLDTQKRIWTGRHIVKGKWVLESNVAEVGSSYKWLVGLLFGGDSERAYGQAETLASRVPIGSNETISLLGPSLMDMRSLGLRAGGILFPVPMTMAEVEKGQIVRAALEAIAFATNQNLRQLESIAGMKAKRIFLCGGFAKSKLYCQILADVLGRNVLVYGSKNMSALGAALCASSGDNSGVTEPIKFSPNAEDTVGYNRYYKKWLSVSKKISKLTEVLS